MSQSDIDTFVSQVRNKDASELGQSFFAVNHLNMADMLQAFQQLTPQERDRFRQAAFDGLPGGGCTSSKTLPQTRLVNIDRIKFGYQVVTDGKVPKVIPGDLYETGQLKDAYKFLKTPAPTLNVWATCIGAVCDDARLRKQGDDSVIMGGDQTYGQAGWDVGIKYGSARFNTLPGLISGRCRGQFLKKFSLNAHGGYGVFAANGVDERAIEIKPAMRFDELDNLRPNFGTVFDFLNNVMTDDGLVFLQGCIAGTGDKGTDLLKRLSLELYPRKVIAFATIGFTSVQKQKRDDDQCREPGVRDTDYTGSSPNEYDRYFKDGQWDDLKNLPWQSETSPHAKVAQNGVIVRGVDL
jgi:hypothetical protein